jgi:hypothetical protein
VEHSAQVEPAGRLRYATPTRSKLILSYYSGRHQYREKMNATRPVPFFVIVAWLVLVCDGLRLFGGGGSPKVRAGGDMTFVRDKRLATVAVKGTSYRNLIAIGHAAWFIVSSFWFLVVMVLWL